MAKQASVRQQQPQSKAAQVESAENKTNQGIDPTPAGEVREGAEQPEASNKLVSVEELQAQYDEQTEEFEKLLATYQGIKAEHDKATAELAKTREDLKKALDFIDATAPKKDGSVFTVKQSGLYKMIHAVIQGRAKMYEGRGGIGKLMEIFPATTMIECEEIYRTIKKAVGG